MVTGRERHRALAHLCVLAALALLATSSIATVLVAWSGTPSVILAVALLAPLLAPLGGLIRGERRTHAWATLCVVPGFVYGLTEAVANPGLRPVAALVLGSSLVFFFALVAFLRVTRPATAQASPTP